jgi:poly-gamma-glutamate synthase PgsB/CapB
MNDISIKALLRLNLSDDWIRIKGSLLQRLEKHFADWQFNTDELEGIERKNRPVIQFVQYLVDQINRWLEEIDTQHQHFNEFRHNYHSAGKDEEALEHMMAIARVLGYSKKALKQIRRGKTPWLDENAVYDFHVQKIALKEQDIASSLQRLSDIVQYLLNQADEASVKQIWRLLALHVSLQRSLEYHGNIHIRIEAFGCLGQSLNTLKNLPIEINHRVPANIVQYIYRSCLDEEINIWLRSEAIMLVSQVNPDQFMTIIDTIFVHQPDSDPFLRGRVVKMMCQHWADTDEFKQAVGKVITDPSDYVRQYFAKHCIGLDQQSCIAVLTQIIEKDDSAQVRAQAYLTLEQLLKPIQDTQEIPADHHEITRDIQIKALASEKDNFALRALLHTLPACALSLSPQAAEDYIAQLTESLSNINQNHSTVGVRRWAAHTREHLWSVSHQSIVNESTRSHLKALPLHKSMSFKVSKDIDKDNLHRYLAKLGSDRFGFDVQDKGNKVKVRAGFKFGFRFWRMWHELRTPATDKRQNHNHLKGRLYYGMSQTSTVNMAELSVTKVPGEPLHISDEQGWRDYLPLLDQVLSSLDQGWPTKAVKLYSAEGITHILPPKSLFRRLYARSVIQLKFQALAKLRNWQEKDSHPANLYIEQLNKLGFKIWIEGYMNDLGQAQLVDPKVQRFFSGALPFVLPSVSDMQNYFYSVYQNTIGQLIVFSCVATVGYLGAHLAKLSAMRISRNKIPLVIGGWGTRGKSGTERLKAALFNAMGLSVVSKTTGCEAMFLYGPANRPMKEMFLFRPYDKASIWEQVFITQLTSKLGADVFLWECMGLTPRYIDIIQNQWMRDDMSTITNCYPDHEDLQGPAGIEIPIVMQRFVPKKSLLIASEESMLPLLEDAAREKKTEISAVTWLDSGLLTKDVVGRFPYEEHPNNIALVARMAEYLGVEVDFALKEMADNVVADLGVLKIYPVAEVQHRRLAFINGMSANERLGAMGNWQRTGLADHTLEQQPDVWVAIVINNRSDRIARSQVFASMLVNDTQADCYFFIGNNLTGLQSYIGEAWKVYSANLQITSEHLVEQTTKFRIPISEKQVLQRLKACIDGLTTISQSDKDVLLESLPETIDPSDWSLPVMEGLETEAIETQFKRDAQLYRQFKDFSEQINGNANIDSGLQQNIINWLYESFKSKWIVVEDYYSTGNQTIYQMVQHTPPGLMSRIIGMQNIKGTGLDFIYRWQAWDKIHEFCETLCKSRDEQALEDAAKALTTWEEFGLLDQQKVRETLMLVKDRPEAQKEILQAELRLIEQRLDKQLGVINDSLQGNQSKSKILSFMINALEAFLDAGDAIKRRKKADQIYQALLDHLISYDKASVELAKITKAQKGGWLEQRIKGRFGS